MGLTGRLRGTLNYIYKSRASYLLMAPFLLFFIVFTVAPVIVAVTLGFTQYNMLEPPVFVGLSNYIKMFLEDDVFVLALQNTMLFALVVGPAGYLLCFLMAWMVSGLKKWIRTVITAIYYIPTIVGIGAYAIWQLLFSADQYGLLNSFLMRFGLISEPLAYLVDTRYIMPILMVVALWMSLGIGFLTFVAGIQTIDPTLYEAGVIDGVRNRFQELWYITMPSMIPQLVFGAVMQIVSSFSVADISIQLAGFPSNAYAGETVVTHIMDYGNIRFDMGYACAMSTILVMIMVFLNRVIVRLLSKLDKS